MKKKQEPWSKKIWYVELLIIFLLIWTATLIGVLTFVLMAISLIIVGIASIGLKASESKKLDVRPVLHPNHSLSHQQINNSSDLDTGIGQNQSLTNLLNIAASGTSSNEQQIAPISAGLPSDVQLEHISQVKYVTFEGARYRVRSKSLKIRNQLINNITDIQGLDKIWRLRKLDLSHNQLTSMKGIEYLPNLRKIKLSHNKIQKIEGIKHFQKLQKLNLDNNQLTELDEADLPNTLKNIDIAKNPIKKFNMYTKSMYSVIHFGSKNWFPEQEFKRLKTQMRRLSKSYVKVDIKGGLLKFLMIFTVWAGITFGIALIINLIIWGAIANLSSMAGQPIPFGFWTLLFTPNSAVPIYFASGFLTLIGMVVLYYEIK